MEPRKQNEDQGADVVVVAEVNMAAFVICENAAAPAWSLDPVHVRKLLTREPGGPVSGLE